MPGRLPSRRLLTGPQQCLRLGGGAKKVARRSPTCSLGKSTPSGHLPLTVYASADQVPPQDEYDISKGFTYMYLKDKPLFPFGHGLSYTNFEYGNLELSEKQAGPDGKFTASIDVRNSGDARRRRDSTAVCSRS